MYTSRYKNGVYVPYEQRICPICDNEVENEIHFLLNCDLYNDFREDLLNLATNVMPTFNDLNVCDKFNYLVANENIVKHTAKTCRLMLDRRKNFINR